MSGDLVSAGWRASPAVVRAALVSTVCATAAVATGRADLVVLGVPFALHVLFGLARRPGTTPTFTTRLVHRGLREGEGTRFVTTVRDADDVELAVVATTPVAHVATSPPAGAVAGLPLPGGAERPGSSVTVDLPLAALRWGRHSVGAGVVAATGPWGARRWGPEPVPAATLVVLPVPGAFDSRAPVPHPIGLVGPHQSRRPGSGSELASVRPFVPGDRPRRVQWRQSLRTGVLHVTGTFAEQDSSVVLLLDTGAEIGSSGGIGGAESSLDITVRAAGAVAEHYLRRGDRVGMRLLGSAERGAVPVRGGAGHLRRLLETLARVTPGGQADVDPARLAARIPTGSVVVVLSPMLSETVAATAVSLSRRGLDVAVVDTLPERSGVVGDDPRRAIAWRLRLLERDTLLERVAHAGVAVVPWRGPGTLDQVLRGLAARARAPRMARR